MKPEISPTEINWTTAPVTGAEEINWTTAPVTGADVGTGTSQYKIALLSSGQLINAWDADSLINKLSERFNRIITVSDEVISSLKTNLDYNGYYIAYLLDQLSEEEFNMIAETYAITLETEESEETIEKIKILFKISRENFSPSDISTIFRIDEEMAGKILANLKDMKHIEGSEDF